MKFGKHLKGAGVEGWVYLDYKSLKKLLKELKADSEDAERQFQYVPLPVLSLIHI